MNEFILKESISPAGLDCPYEFEHYIITDGKTTILAKDDSEGHEQALMLLAVMNAYGGTIWVDDSHKLIISHQKKQIDAMTTDLASQDAEIERLKKLIQDAYQHGYNAGTYKTPAITISWEEFKNENNL